MDVQLRTDEGDLRRVDSIREAFVIAADDETIVKVSWNAEDGNVRFVRCKIGATTLWVFDPMEWYLPGGRNNVRDGRSADTASGTESDQTKESS